MALKKNMTQEEHIALLQQQKKDKITAANQQIQALYQQYVQGHDTDIDDIIEALDKRYRGMVVHVLYTSGCHDDENEGAAMQEARIAVWNLLNKSRDEGVADPMFMIICKGIYYHKVMDVIRKVYNTSKHYGGNMVSIDAELPDGKGTIGSLIKDSTPVGSDPALKNEVDEKQRFFQQSFEIYCKALTSSSAEPPRCLALYYARVLPHILHVGFSIDTIPESKASSPKWAVKKMGTRSIGVLSIESEMQLKEFVSEELMWCTAYEAQLDHMMETSSGPQIMRNVVFTDQFNEKQIGHMTDYMHKVVAKDWLRLMMKDPKMIECAIDYTAGSRQIFSIVKGGSTR